MLLFFYLITVYLFFMRVDAVFRVYVCVCVCMCVCVHPQSLSHVQLFLTSWTVACQAPLTMGFPRQKYCSGLPFSPPRDLPNLGIEPASPALAGGFFTPEPPGYWHTKVLK